MATFFPNLPFIFSISWVLFCSIVVLIKFLFLFGRFLLGLCFFWPAPTTWIDLFFCADLCFVESFSKKKKKKKKQQRWLMRVQLFIIFLSKIIGFFNVNYQVFVDWTAFSLIAFVAFLLDIIILLLFLYWYMSLLIYIISLFCTFWLNLCGIILFL